MNSQCKAKLITHLKKYTMYGYFPSTKAERISRNEKGSKVLISKYTEDEEIIYDY